MKLNKSKISSLAIAAILLLNNQNNTEAVALSKVENLEFFMLNKGKASYADSDFDNQLVQLDSNLESHNHGRMRVQDDFNVAAVDDIMKKYDETEKAEKQNEEFVKVLKKDNKLLTFFIENYSPGTDANDDTKFISYEFSKFCE